MEHQGAAKNGSERATGPSAVPTATGRRRHRKPTSVLLALALVVGVLVVEFAQNQASAEVTGLPAGFTDSVVFSGLNNPTVIQFGPDGRVWVGEKSGIIKVYDNLNDPTPTVFADLRTEVHNWWDRGLLGLVLDPQFPTRPYVYVQYSYDKQPGNAAMPRWGSPGDTDDYCADPPGATDSGCVVMGRISRLTVSGAGAGNTMVGGSENVLVEDWCDQFPSHSIGTIVFGPDGYLYAAGGDGASFTEVDWGQLGGKGGVPVNACGDPGGGTAGGAGGALRAQSVRVARSAGSNTSLDGAMIRIDPDTGAAAPGNPLIGRANANERRVIAYGLRNPFRFTFRPGTNQMWIGDVGWNDTEEINTFTVGSGGTPNFGWPCYEGTEVNAGVAGNNLGLCTSLYDQGAAAVVQPHFSYSHYSQVVPGDNCASGATPYGSSVTGLTFYGGSSYPVAYQGALFFTDYNRKCLWVMKKGGDGTPDPNQVSRFAKLGAYDGDGPESDGGAVDLVSGPGGDLFWVDLYGGKIHRITFASDNTPPVARIVANPTNGPAPLAVSFNGSTSSDPDGNALSYQWDFDNDGTVDATGATTSHTYPSAGTFTAKLTVTDNGSPAKADSATVTISPGNTPPVPVIDSPAPALTWKVGDQIDFSGHATDPQGGPVQLDWKLRFLTCSTPTDCLPRYQTPYNDTASGTYTVPDWGGAGHNVLEFALTATDSDGLAATTTLRVEPQVATLRIESTPGSGRKIALDSSQVTTPYAVDYIVGSGHSIGIPASETGFLGWSDGGAANHRVFVAPGGTTVTANFETPAPPTTQPPTTQPPTTQPPATGFAALPHETQVAIINFLAWVNWMRFVEFCRAVLRFQAAAKAKAKATHKARR